MTNKKRSTKPGVKAIPDTAMLFLAVFGGNHFN
jgi:hypothetical protein